MVSKITIFEPHFDGAQFGPTSIESGESMDDAEAASEDAEDAQGRSLLRIAALFGAIIVGLVVGLRMIRRTEVMDTESVEIEEHAADEMAMA